MWCTIILRATIIITKATPAVRTSRIYNHAKIIMHIKDTQARSNQSMLVFNTSFYNSRKWWRGWSSNGRVRHWRKRDLGWLIHAWHARTLPCIRSEILRRVVALRSVAKFHRLQNVIVIVELKRSTARTAAWYNENRTSFGISRFRHYIPNTCWSQSAPAAYLLIFLSQQLHEALSTNSRFSRT